MSGRKSFGKLTSTLPRDKVDAVKERLRGEMSLAELREARHLTQETIGSILNVGQSSVAKVEKRTDMYVGTLRRVVTAMGGELDIIARFPDGEIKINNFADIDGPSQEHAGRPRRRPRPRA